MANNWLYIAFVFVLSFGNFATFAQEKKKSICEAALSPIGEHDATVLQAHLFSKAIDFAKVKNILEHYTGEKPLWGGVRLKERKTPKARELTRQMILYFLRSRGLDPIVESFHLGEREGANIVVEIPGTDLKDEVVEFGAHYDTEDDDVPGADDNGTGLALLLHFPDLLKKYQPRRTVRLVFYDLEEAEAEGSSYHAQQIKKDKRKNIGTLIVDMIGYFPKDGKIPLAVVEIAEGKHSSAADDFDDDEESDDDIRKKPYPPELSAEARKNLDARNRQLGKEIFYQLQRLPIDRGVQLSAEIDNSSPDSGDHGSYWENGEPAVLFSTHFGGKYTNPANHKRTDTVDALNWPFYESVATLFTEIAGYMMRITPVEKDILAAPGLLKAENVKLGKIKIPKSLKREEHLLVKNEEEEKDKEKKKEYPEKKDVKFGSYISEKLDALKSSKADERILLLYASQKRGIVIYKGDLLDFEFSGDAAEIVKAEFKFNGGAYVQVAEGFTAQIAFTTRDMILEYTFGNAKPKSGELLRDQFGANFLWYPKFGARTTETSTEEPMSEQTFANTSELMRILRNVKPDARVLVLDKPTHREGMVLYKGSIADFEFSGNLASSVKDEFERNGGQVVVVSEKRPHDLTPQSRDMIIERTFGNHPAIHGERYKHDDGASYLWVEKSEPESPKPTEVMPGEKKVYRPPLAMDLVATRLYMNSLTQEYFNDFKVTQFMQFREQKPEARVVIINEAETRGMVLYSGDTGIALTDKDLIKAIKRDMTTYGGRFIRAVGDSLLKIGSSEKEELYKYATSGISESGTKFSVNNGKFVFYEGL